MYFLTLDNYNITNFKNIINDPLQENKPITRKKVPSKFMSKLLRLHDGI